MKSRDDLNSTAIHEAGHVAACINLDLEFDAVYLEPSKDHPSLVSKLVMKAGIDYSSGVLSPEEESLSTNLVIVGFAGPAVDALHRGRTSFDITEYEDLDEVLDAIEYRFANNNVRIAFTHYCEAEAFALFEDDRRLWRFTHLLARELARQKKLTYAQCMELYSKEYLAESWVRKEVDEIRREGEAKDKEGTKGEEGLAASYEQRAASIEKGPKGQEKRHKGQEASPKHQAAGREQKPPVQDREAPKHEEVVTGAAEGFDRPAEEGGAQQERRGKRRRRGRGRGRGKKKEGVLEALPGEVISGQPVEEATPPAPKGEERSQKPQAAGSVAGQQQKQPQPKAPGQQQQAQRGKVAGVELGAVNDKAQATIGKTQDAGGNAEAQKNIPPPGGDQPKGEERPKIQLVKAVKPPVELPTPEVPVEASQAAGAPKPVEAVMPPVAEPRPVEAPPVVPPPAVPEVAAEARAAAAEPPKRRPAVTGKKTEGKAVRGKKGTSHPDSIWEGEDKEAASDKRQAKSDKLQATSSKSQVERQTAPPTPLPEAPGTAGAPGVTAEGKKPAKAAKPRTAKAARVQEPAPGTPGKQSAPRKQTPAPEAPAGSKPTKAARPAKAAKTAKAAPAEAPAPEAPVKKARKAPAKKAVPEKGAPKKAAPKKSGGRKKGE